MDCTVFMLTVHGCYVVVPNMGTRGPDVATPVGLLCVCAVPVRCLCLSHAISCVLSVLLVLPYSVLYSTAFQSNLDIPLIDDRDRHCHSHSCAVCVCLCVSVHASVLSLLVPPSVKASKQVQV